ncbi:PREDICTED: uncharacterized mitochondrial protein AtMg00810-like [Theobroma cacao]|uniref:Uncharacterized mitochondrial protein AtMg00810-like n=1 Tax=Theobroma cacao TaxID=3641 RepID=A0AB32W6G5_THECC|nr:PREDICTED: uncharacterized mitochondrial protein AtMg00810-like [Theobroma cacao]
MEQEMQMIDKNGTWILVDKPEERFLRSANEPTLYVYKSSELVRVIISLYVDDLLITSVDDNILSDCKTKLMREFEMSDLGEMHYFLGLQFIQSADSICIHQKKYATKLLKRFHMENCKSVETPLTSNSKLSKDDGTPKAIYAKPSHNHYLAAKRVLRYIKGTVDYGLRFEKDKSSELVGFCDNDWAVSLDDSKST